MDGVLTQSLDCLRWHAHPEWGDRTPLDVFNRLLAKNVRPETWTRCTHLNIQLHQIRSHREQRTTAQLALLARGHSSVTGEDFACPIIIAVYLGKERVLDGNHRINRWVARGDTSLHDVNVHVVDSAGKFVELAAVSSAAS